MSIFGARETVVVCRHIMSVQFKKSNPYHHRCHRHRHRHRYRHRRLSKRIASVSAFLVEVPCVCVCVYVGQILGFPERISFI